MFGKPSSQYPSNPPRPRDQHEGPSHSLGIKDQLKRISLSHLIEFLSRYRVGASILLIAVMGGLLYTGYRPGQSGNRALPADPAVLSESREKVTGIGPDTQAARPLREMSEKYSQLEAQFKERETVISSLRNEIKELQSKFIAEHRMNTELLAQLGPSDKTIREFQHDRLSVPSPLRHKGFQMQFSSIIAPKGYLIWAPEQVTENGFYIDGTHYALFKCLQKVEPMDLLGEAERKTLFFAITVGDTVVSPVPYLNMLPVEEGTHKIKIESLSGAAENNAKETVVKLMARQVEFIEIDGIDVLSVEGGARIKLKSFDLGSAVQGLSKALAKMDVDNDCLLEVLTTR
jgi:hypothetical protein